MRYVAHKIQSEAHKDRSRIRGFAAGKRAGKTEFGAIESIIFSEQQIGYLKSDVDPYAGCIIAPTNDMLWRLSLKKLLAYAKPFNPKFNKSKQTIDWPNGSEIHAISGEKPERIEGMKLNWIWIDEVFQVSEQLFLECLARVSDTQGYIWCTGSLGTQYTNPKRHWFYKHFKEKPLPGTKLFECTTSDNPYFPKDELLRLKDTLDPRTYRQMFEIDWSVPGTNLVFENFDEGNQIESFQLEPHHEVYISIDWGWAHDMACLFFAYDRKLDTVTLFDEIVSSHLTLDNLYNRIKSKNMTQIRAWICDIAGNQEREQTGRSNIKWFEDKGIRFKTRRTAVTYGIPIMRGYIQDGMGKKRFFIDAKKCPKSLDGFMNYSYPEKDGTIVNENPVKKADDVVDSARYFWVNVLDKTMHESELREFNRWGEWKF